MNDDIKDKKIILEMIDLLMQAEMFQEEIENYCELMKQSFLATSTLN